MLNQMNLLLLSLLMTSAIPTQKAALVTSVKQRAILRHILQRIEKRNPALSHKALDAAVKAYLHLHQMGEDQKEWLTIVNFNKPSTAKRLWVIDMQSGTVKFNTYVAHAKNTGLNIAKRFSNRVNSDESSLGVYLTSYSYYGSDGYSMKVRGLEKKFNTNAFRRNVVMHGAWYVSKPFLKKYGRLGRTLGCFGLDKKVASKIIKTIKNGTVLVAYYPDKKWLNQSIYERPI